MKKKKPRKKKRGSEAQLITEDLNARAKVDRICFESQKNGQLSSQTLTYLHHLSKFVKLRALPTKLAKEVTN